MIKNRIINSLEAAMIYFCWLGVFLTVDQFITNDIPAETAELHDEIVTIAAAEEIETPPAPALIDTPIIFEHAEYKTFYDITQSLDYIAVLTEHTGVINNAINSKEYTKAAEVAMNIELNRINDIISSIEFDVDQYSAWEQEYYYAAKTYEFFRQNGFSLNIKLLFYFLFPIVDYHSDNGEAYLKQVRREYAKRARDNVIHAPKADV